MAMLNNQMVSDINWGWWESKKGNSIPFSSRKWREWGYWSKFDYMGYKLKDIWYLMIWDLILAIEPIYGLD